MKFDYIFLDVRELPLTVSAVEKNGSSYPRRRSGCRKFGCDAVGSLLGHKNHTAGQMAEIADIWLHINGCCC